MLIVNEYICWPVDLDFIFFQNSSGFLENVFHSFQFHIF